MGNLGLTGTVVVVDTADGPDLGGVLGLVLFGPGPEKERPAVPPGFWSSRPVADTMRESWVARLKAATGPTRSRLMVRRCPTGETCALCWSVGAKSTNHTPKAAMTDAEHLGPRRVHAAVGWCARRRLGVGAGFVEGRHQKR